MAQTVSTNSFFVAKWVVSPTLSDGATHTTIQAAINSASSGDTIYVRDSTYTENITLKAGVNICSLIGSELTPNVSIVGKLSFSSAGTVTISGIRLTTNSDNFLAVTGTAASIVRLECCYLNCLNNTGISYTSSDTGSIISITRCQGNLGTTGIALFTATGTGTITIVDSSFSNSGSSLTASNTSACVVNIVRCNIVGIFSTSSTGVYGIYNSIIDGGSLNITCLTTAGTGFAQLYASSFFSGSASAISVGAGTTVTGSQISVSSSNTNAITGLGTVSIGDISMSGSSSLINTSTKTGLNTLMGGVSFNGGTNVLSTYTTGTWTPSLSLSTPGTSSFTYSAQAGTYTQIGNVVFIQARLILTNFTVGTGSGNVQLITLPITPGSTANSHITCSMQNITFGVGVSWYIANIATSSTTVLFSGCVTATTFSNLQAAGLSNTSIIVISGQYTTQ